MPQNLFAIDYAGADERTLTDLARGGDPQAFRAIMQRCNQRLFRIARSVVGDDDEAQDVVQETYLRAFTAIAGFRGEAGIFTWLATIALNEARGRLRLRRPKVELEVMDSDPARIIAFPSPLGAPSPEAQSAVRETRRLLEQAIDDLPPAFRVVFMLRDVEGCSVEETAAQLDLKPETVKTRLFRARRLLRKALDQSLSAALTGAFPFLGPRCEAITEEVLRRLDAGEGPRGA